MCAAPVGSAVGQICSNPLALPASLPWASYVRYDPFAATNAIDPLTPHQDSYYATPAYYITDLGPNAGSPGEVYQIDAVGYGEERPVAANDTPKNKALNRRIEFSATKLVN